MPIRSIPGTPLLGSLLGSLLALLLAGAPLLGWAQSLWTTQYGELGVVLTSKTDTLELKHSNVVGVYNPATNAMTLSLNLAQLQNGPAGQLPDSLTAAWRQAEQSPVISFVGEAGDTLPGPRARTWSWTLTGELVTPAGDEFPLQLEGRLEQQDSLLAYYAHLDWRLPKKAFPGLESGRWGRTARAQGELVLVWRPLQPTHHHNRRNQPQPPGPKESPLPPPR